MRSADDVREVFRLRAQGLSQHAIAGATGVSVSTIKRWFSRDEEVLLAVDRRSVQRTDPANCELVGAGPHDAYAYLLGQYLGDGHIVHDHRGVYRLSIYCCAAYPNIIEECADAIALVLPANKVGRVDDREWSPSAAIRSTFLACFRSTDQGSSISGPSCCGRGRGRSLSSNSRSCSCAGSSTAMVAAARTGYAARTAFRTRTPGTSSATGQSTYASCSLCRAEIMSGCVPGAGFEPARPFGQCSLSASCMPVPPPGQGGPPA